MRPRHAQDKRRQKKRDERSGTAERPQRAGARPERDGAKPQRAGERTGGKPKRGEARRGERPVTKRGERPEKKRGERPEKKRGERPEKKRGERPAKKRTGRVVINTVNPAQQKPAAEPPARRVPLSPPRGGIQVGDWLLTTREGSEQDLIDEFVLAGVVRPPGHVFAPALVVMTRWPKREKQLVPVTFARQALPVQANVQHDDWDVLVARVGKTLVEKLAGAPHYALQVWVPDSTGANPLASTAEQLEARLEAFLAGALRESKRLDDSALRRLGSMPFAQVCLVEQNHAVAGVMYSNQAISLARGGRTRVRVTGELPSRAARKVEEALAWLGVAPGPGEVCVDLGAAPGGWTYVLSERRARVIAVDPAKLRPEIAARKNVEHVTQNAFNYEPKERADWLFCDMAYRPLEVAALLARWGRRSWARMLVANIKLPMTKKAEILARVRHILEQEGDWKHVKSRQLYHDRDEITLTALRA